MGTVAPNQVELLITAKIRQRRTNIAHIGIELGPNGWRCEKLWMVKDAPHPSNSKLMALLAEADMILADILRKHEIVGPPPR